MSEAKHTPGPWRTCNPYSSGNRAILSEAVDATHDIAVVSARYDEIDANAALIASAPELLEACQMCLPIMQGRWPKSEEVEFLNAAIAKAKEVQS